MHQKTKDKGPIVTVAQLGGCSSFFLALLVACTGAARADPAEDLAASVREAVAGLTARDVGGRYGQALGAIEICSGTKVTDKASVLNSLYEGEDLEAFKAQAAKIYDAWIKVKHCVREDDPNQCKVIMDESCAAAMAEIGPKGTALPGLLEGPPR